MYILTEATSVGFENINLNDVDPGMGKPDNGVPLTFIVSEAKVKSYDKTAEGGQAGTFISFKFTITNSDRFSGKSYYASLFPDKPGKDGSPSKNTTARQCRILMDATGVPQSGTFDQWLEELVSSRATFDAPLQPNYKDPAKQDVSLFKATASA